MKNLYLMAALLLCSIGIAQNKNAKKATSNPVRFGLKVGVNIAKLTDMEDPNLTTAPRTGINAGVYLNYKFSPTFAFQPELLYTTQGNKQRGFTNGFGFEAKYKFDYIAVPLMVKYYPTKILTFEFGPQMAFNVKKDIEITALGRTLTYDLNDFFQNNGIRGNANTFDFGLNFGIGAELDNGLNFGARYSLGLTKVIEGRDIVDFNDHPQTIKNSVFTFGMGYTFN